MALKEETIGQNEDLSLCISSNDSPFSARVCAEKCFSLQMPFLFTLLVPTFSVHKDEKVISTKYIFVFLQNISSQSRAQEVQLIMFLTAPNT